MPDAADRQLLFGLLGLQAGLIDREGLIAGFQAWTLDRSRTLADHLTALGGLDDDRRATVEALVRLHHERREDQATVADAGLDATRPSAGEASTVPDAVFTRADGPVVESNDGGRFRFLRPHARGNLGTVCVAFDSELNREVALKRIREEYADDPASRRRFLVEAEVAGRLEHPGIVPVYGLGADDDGRPYYAMRLVRGDSFQTVIDDFHKGPRSRSERSLKIRRLLKIFTDVCNAIDYAHSRGVLHRDVKPANVVVGEHGETLVVDWGLAKASGRDAPGPEARASALSAGGGSSETLPGRAMGTPGYMSPEQARGDLERVGPPSDVYSLGATLHHLLTGRAPFQGPLSDVLRRVAEGEFPRPRESDAAIDPALEAIVLKAMAREPAARYVSARALAYDVERWLADERVEAFAEPWHRTLIRWLTRHRTVVTGLAAAGLVAFAVLGTLSVAQKKANSDLAAGNRALTLQRKRAEENEAQAIEAVKRFKDAVADNPKLKDDPGLQSLRETLLKEPMAFFSRFRERLQADADARPESLYRLADAAREHALLIGEIGDKKDAIQVVGQAIAIFERLVRDHPDVAAYRSGLAASQVNLGDMLRYTGRPDEARAAFARAVAIQERLIRDRPDALDFQIGLARSLAFLGAAELSAGRLDDAQAAFERVLDVGKRLARDHPGVLSHQGWLAGGHTNLGVLYRAAGRLDEARAAFERAIEVRERLIGDDPDAADQQEGLATSLLYLGTVHAAAGRLDEARATFERAVEIHERLVRDHPAVTRYQADLLYSRDNLGGALRDAGRLDEARTVWERAAELGERLVRDRPEVPEYADGLGTVLKNMGAVELQASRFDEARGRLREAVSLRKKALAADPRSLRYRRALEDDLAKLAAAERGLGREDEAARVERELAELQAGDPTSGTVTPPSADGEPRGARPSPAD